MKDNSYLEMSVKDILINVLKNCYFAFLVAIICALAAFCYTKAIVKPSYESTSSLYVINQQEEGALTSGDLTSAEQLKNDVQYLIVSRTVLEEVIRNLGLDSDLETLKKMISISSPVNTRFIDVTVTSSSPKDAQRIVNELVQISKKQILDNMEVTSVNIIDKGQYPTKMSAPNLKKNVLSAALVGGFIAMVVLVLLTLMDDSIKSEDDIMKYFGISTLGVVPEIRYLKNK